MSVVLACDLGSGSFRASLVDAQGATRAEHVIIGPAICDRADLSEVDADDWWSIFTEAAAALVQSAPALFADIAGIAICGITRTQVLLASDGSPLCSAMTWKDARSAAVAARLGERFAGRHPEIGGINAFHPFARLAWLRDAGASMLARLATVLEPKDYLNFRLTGARAGDPVSFARLLAAAEPYQGFDLFAAIGITPAVLPDMIEPTGRVGLVQSGLGAPFADLAGVPVFCCSNDTWVGAAGLGALRAGYAYNISGTTEVLGIVGAAPARSEGLLTVDWRGLYQLGGPSQNGADSLVWLLSLLGRLDGGQIGRSLDALLAGTRQKQPILFLPYLQGERVPYWDPSLRGAFVGLNRQHGPTDVTWAVLEGIAFLNRLVLDRAEAAAGFTAREIRIGGGGGSNAIWRQLKADICRRPVVAGFAKEPGILGAALVAWTGLGRFPTLAAAQGALVRTASRHEPDPARGPLSDPGVGRKANRRRAAC
jgi:xylulokinase